MRIDVFTLFPDWFDWFTGQRHVRNALGMGHELALLDYRAHTPLSAGQVDDTPFGGGAGMVLRVDVVEAALRARYAEDPVDLRDRRRVIALDPSGRGGPPPPGPPAPPPPRPPPRRGVRAHPAVRTL